MILLRINRELVAFGQSRNDSKRFPPDIFPGPPFVVISLRSWVFMRLLQAFGWFSAPLKMSVIFLDEPHVFESSSWKQFRRYSLCLFLISHKGIKIFVFICNEVSQKLGSCSASVRKELHTALDVVYRKLSEIFSRCFSRSPWKKSFLCLGIIVTFISIKFSNLQLLSHYVFRW